MSAKNLDRWAVIRFSHNYPKLHGQKMAELLAVRFITISKTTNPEMLEYDTRYENADGTIGHYPLKSGQYMRLIFDGDKGIPFTTIRKAWPRRKVKFYEEMVGETFMIDVEETGDDCNGGDCERHKLGAEPCAGCPYCDAEGNI